MRLFRSITWVALPRSAMTSVSLPTARNLPSLMATAAAVGFSRSTVWMRPLCRIRSAVMEPPWVSDCVEPAAPAKGMADQSAPAAPSTELAARK
ncbi:hypothetical protein D3C76_810380 [compost metagenome]